MSILFPFFFLSSLCILCMRTLRNPIMFCISFFVPFFPCSLFLSAAFLQHLFNSNLIMCFEFFSYISLLIFLFNFYFQICLYNASRCNKFQRYHLSGKRTNQRHNILGWNMISVLHVMHIIMVPAVRIYVDRVMINLVILRVRQRVRKFALPAGKERTVNKVS